MRRGESHLCSAASLSHNFSSTQARLPSHSHVTCVQIFSSMPHHRDRHYDLLPLSFDGPKKRGCARPAAVAQPHLVCLLLPACCCCCVQAHLVASPSCASGARAQIVDAKRSGRRQRATIIIFQRPDAKVRPAHCARTPASHTCCPCVTLRPPLAPAARLPGVLVPRAYSSPALTAHDPTRISQARPRAGRGCDVESEPAEAMETELRPC